MAYATATRHAIPATPTAIAAAMGIVTTILKMTIPAPPTAMMRAATGIVTLI
jgi:hypothetical protein